MRSLAGPSRPSPCCTDPAWSLSSGSEDPSRRTPETPLAIPRLVALEAGAEMGEPLPESFRPGSGSSKAAGPDASSPSQSRSLSLGTRNKEPRRIGVEGLPETHLPLDFLHRRPRKLQSQSHPGLNRRMVPVFTNFENRKPGGRELPLCSPEPATPRRPPSQREGM